MRQAVLAEKSTVSRRYNTLPLIHIGCLTGASVPMASPRFYVSQPLPRPPQSGLSVELNEEIARHLQVLRMAVDDPITLFDGSGGEWSASVSGIGKRHATVQLLKFDPVERESPLNITLVQALATSDKMDFIVQKAVELGVAAIQPVASERATMKLAGDRVQKRTAHWQAVAQSACEQCGRNLIPAVAETMSLEDWLAMPNSASRLMLHPDADGSLVAVVGNAPALCLLIGPEGGFSEKEVALARMQGIQAVRFGPRVLRTETAGLAAIAALNAVHGDFR